MTGPGLEFLGAVEAAALVRRGEVSPVELVAALLERAEEVDGSINAYVEVLEDEALQAARQLEHEAAKGSFRGLLHGVPVAVKDVIDVAGRQTRLGSAAVDPAPAAADAVAVARLRAAGAIVLAKSVTHEFAYGVTSPPTRNPHDLERIAGGSSGGSAAAVAAGMVPLALGTDCSGSVRIPASLCGVVGFKPTFGLIPHEGCTPLAWSLDHVGVLVRDPADATLAITVLSGDPPRDGNTAESWSEQDRVRARGRGPAGDGLAGVRLGIPDRHSFDGLDEPVSVAITETLAALEATGAEVVEVPMPALELAMDAQYAILRPEAAAYHATTLRDHGDKLGTRVRHLLEVGQDVPATAYVNGHRVRALIQESFRAAFRDVDVLVGPTCPVQAPLAGADVISTAGKEEAISPALVRLCVPANLAGVPAVSVPCGPSSAMPIGLQLMGPAHADTRLLEIAQAVLSSLGQPAGSGELVR